jgi:hypothetical protein
LTIDEFTFVFLSFGIIGYLKMIGDFDLRFCWNHTCEHTFTNEKMIIALEVLLCSAYKIVTGKWNQLATIDCES